MDSPQCISPPASVNSTLIVRGMLCTILLVALCYSTWKCAVQHRKLIALNNKGKKVVHFFVPVHIKVVYACLTSPV